jgi:tRNA pseudouridine55 synthase
MRKRYRALFQLGVRSATDDVDSPLEEMAVSRPPEQAKVDRALAGFVGTIEQRPPAYSAVHVEGRRAHELARRGEPVELEPRSVVVYAMEVRAYTYPRLELDIECGSGTYVRSIARDLGDALGCGAVLEELERTAIGPFRVEEAVEPVGLERDRLAAILLPPAAAVCELPAVRLGVAECRRLVCGQAVACNEEFTTGVVEVAVFDSEGELVGVAAYDRNDRVLRSCRVLVESGVRKVEH